MIGYDEIIEKTKAVPTNFNEQKYTLKYKNVCTCIFINYNKVNDICVYLLSSGKISSKIKKIITISKKKKKKTHLKSFLLIIYYEKIESKNGIKEIDIRNHTCYHFNNIIKFQDFDLDIILIDEK